MRLKIAILFLIGCLVVELLAFNLPSGLTQVEQIDSFCKFTSLGFLTLSMSFLFYINSNEVGFFKELYKLLLFFTFISSTNCFFDELSIVGLNPSVYQISEFALLIGVLIYFIFKIKNLCQNKK